MLYPCSGNSENTRRLANVGLQLNQRRRRWPNSKPTLGERHLLAEIILSVFVCRQSKNSQTFYSIYFHIHSTAVIICCLDFRF